MNLENEMKIESTLKGTRILSGDYVKKRRKLLNSYIELLEGEGFQEIILPIIESSQIYIDKAGEEVLEQIYSFNDKGERLICLRPEGTATCQLLAKEKFKLLKNVKVFYITNCYRYERPQSGRYREFLQFGVEILNPTKDYKEYIENLAESMIKIVSTNYSLDTNVKRGLNYYVGEGFEIKCEELGAQKQVCGGGIYNEGIGFALGIDRLMLLK